MNGLSNKDWRSQEELFIKANEKQVVLIAKLAVQEAKRRQNIQETKEKSMQTESYCLCRGCERQELPAFMQWIKLHYGEWVYLCRDCVPQYEEER